MQWLRLHVPRSCSEVVPCLQDAAVDGEVSAVRPHSEDPVSTRVEVQVTPRDRELFGLLSRARWLTTSQVQRALWPGKSANAVAKRMKRLGVGGYVRSIRPGMTEECWHRLSALGLELAAGDNAQIETLVARRLPKQRQHFASINDIRLWLEMQFGRERVSYKAEWEVKAINERPAVVPDAMAVIQARECEVRMGIEVDCSTENPRMVARKLSGYARSLSDLEGVLIWVPGPRRLRSVVAAFYREGVEGALPCWIADSGRLWSMGPDSPDFIDVGCLEDASRSPATSLAALLGCPVDVSSRQESDRPTTPCAKGGSARGAVRPYGTAVEGGRWG